MKRSGDKISIPGDYQFNAYYQGGRVRKFWHRVRLMESEKALGVNDGENILDIGCGSGVLAAKIASVNNVQVLGIDANPSAIQFCRSTWHLPNLQFENKQIDELEYPEKSFHKVLLLEVIEHISAEQAEVLLKKIQHILRPGGMLVMTTPNKKSLWPLLEFFMDLFRLSPRMKHDQHELLYSRKKLKRLAMQAGMKTISVKTFFHISPWMALISPAFARWIHRTGMKMNAGSGALILLICSK